MMKRHLLCATGRVLAASRTAAGSRRAPINAASIWATRARPALHARSFAEEAAAAAAAPEQPAEPVEEPVKDEKDARIEQLEKETKDLQDKCLRTMAESENMRTRSMKNVDDAKKFALQKFATSLLEVADNLGMALASVPEQDRKQDQKLNAFLEGIEGTDRLLHKILSAHGVTRVWPLNEKFDPHKHEALFEMPKTGEAEPGTCGQVLKAGYCLNDRLLRPAQVGVVQEAK